MCTHLFIVILSATSCFCYAGYELFQGFYVTDVNDTSDTPTETSYDYRFDNEPETSYSSHITLPTKQTTTTHNTTSTSTIYKDLIEITSLEPNKFDCSEDEKPANIGPYEVPTQRDMVLFTRNILLEMFNSYNKEAFYLLKDIRAATKATSSIEKKCEGNKMAYRQCVKLVSKQCQQITKNLVKSVENQKQEILNLTKVKICNLSQMMTDPIEMLRTMAQEKMYLEFALPGFLRLLSACSSNCIRSASASSNYKNKPMRHMTDQDLVIKHFLTGKKYFELIMDSRHKSTANSN